MNANDVPCGSPWPIDDDVQTLADLPPDVAANITHAAPAAPTPTGAVGATLALIDAVRDLTEEMAAMRAQIEARANPFHDL